MNRFKAGVILDFVVKNILIFFASFVWARFFIESLAVAVIVSIAISTVICYLLFVLGKRKKNRKQLKSEDKKKMIETMQELIFSSNEIVINFFYNIFKNKHTAVKHKNFLLLQNENEKFIVAPLFLLEKITLSHLLPFYNKAKQLKIKKIVVLACEYENNLSSAIKKLPVEILLFNKEDVFVKILKENNTYPEITLKQISSPKLTFSAFLDMTLNKQKTKTYFFMGLITLLFASFVMYSLYYTIIASLLFVLSVLSYFYKRNTKEESKIF